MYTVVYLRKPYDVPRVLGAVLRPGLAALVVLLLAPAASAAPAPTTIRIALVDGETPTHDAPPGMVHLATDDGDRWAWNLTLVDAYTVAEIRASGFDLERPRQLLPEYDDAAQHGPNVEAHLHPHFFTEVRSDVADVDSPVRIVNFTEDGDAIVIRLGLTGPGNATLLLTKDTTPPRFTLGEPTDVNHYRFILKTTTDEFAFGDLRIRPAAGGDEVPNQTPVPALEQTFPVQGLREDTEYVAYVVFTDWSGNEARSETFTVRTLPKPYAEPPDFVVLAPAANSTVEAGPRVLATFDSATRVERGGVQVFLDKTAVVDFSFVRDNVAPNRVTVVVVPEPPLGPGLHHAAVEVTDEAGGKAVARWSFTVADRDAPPAGLAALVIPAALAALWRPRRG